MKYFDMVEGLPDEYPGISQCEIVMMSLENDVLYASLQDSLGSCSGSSCLGRHILKGEVLAHRGWLVREDTRVIVNIISKKIKLPRTTFHYSAYKHLRHNISCELGLSCSARILAAILMRSKKGKT